MSISFDENKKEFRLVTKDFSYIFYINPKGIPIHLFAGATPERFDLNECIGPDVWNDYRYYENGEETTLPGYVMEKDLTECASYGRLDKRSAFAILEKENGSKITDFRYRSHAIFSQKEKSDVFPSLRGEEDVTTLDLVLFDADLQCEMHLFYSVYPRLNLIVRKSRLVNQSGKTYRVLKLSSAQMDFPAPSFDLLSFGGGYTHEFSLSREKLTLGRKILDSNRGLSSHQIHPLAILSEGKTDENQGFCVGFSFVYSGDFSFEFVVDEWGQTRFVGGVNPETFGYLLKGKESLESPELAMAFSSAGFSGLSASFYALVRQDVVPVLQRSLSRYVLLNSWEAYYFAFDTTKVLSAISKAHDWGISLFVLDDGWFGKRDTDTCSLGDWWVNDKKIDLMKAIDYAHALGMAFGLWLEPEMVSYDSDLYRSHPDFVSMDPTTDVHSLHRHQLILDLSQDRVERYLENVLDGILERYPLDYLKWDYNRDSSEMAPIDAECFRRYRNLYRLLNHLTTHFPRLYIETCAGGGGRFDLGMLSYSSRIWASDNQDARDRSFIQYGASFFYPPEVISAHVNHAPDNASYEAKIAVAFFGSFGFELDPGAEDSKVVEEGVALYAKYHAILDNGRIFRLASPYRDGALGLECLSQDGNEIALLWNPVDKKPRTHHLSLHGLSEGSVYVDGKTGREFYGSDLEEGLDVEWFKDAYDGRLLFLKKK